MQHPHRRRIVYSLLEQNPHDPLAVPEDLCAREREVEEFDLELVHCHLPLLEDAGLVSWDREDGLVQRGPAFEDAEPLVESIRDQDDFQAAADTSLR